MVEFQSLGFSLHRTSTGLVLSLTNRPSYNAEWVERALEGISPTVHVSERLEGERRSFLLTWVSQDRESLEELRLKVRARMQEISDQRPVFEPPYPAGKPYAHTA